MDRLNPIIFNLSSEPIIRKVKEFKKLIYLGTRIKYLHMAITVCIMFETSKKMNDIFNVIYRVAVIRIKFNPNIFESFSFFSIQQG